MPLQNYKTNKLPMVIAVIVLFFFYSGIIYAITFVGHQRHSTIGESPTALMIHPVNLAGVDEAKEVTHQHDDEEILNKAIESAEKTIEEVSKEAVIEKTLEEQQTIIQEEPKEMITVDEAVKESPKVQKSQKIIEKAATPKKVTKNQSLTKRQSKRVQQNVVVNSNQVHVIAQPKPVYPRSVVMRNLKGVTTVLIKIDKNGRAVSVTVAQSSGDRQIDAAALKAAMKTRIKPYMIDGEPIELTVRTVYERS